MADVIQVVMLDVLLERLSRWAESEGLEVTRTPFLDDEGDEAAIPTYHLGLPRMMNINPGPVEPFEPPKQSPSAGNLPSEPTAR
jgi:hypothetical protein